MRLSFLLLCLIAARAFGADLTSAIPANSRKVILVTTPDWLAPTGTLRRFERRDAHSPWQPVGKPVAVLLGKHGLGWASGLAAIPNETGPRKTEGDLRAPAGVFALGEAFGAMPHSAMPWVRMPYRTLTPTTEGIDDPTSRFYNHIVDRAQVATPDWHSSERMWNVRSYELGIVIATNPQCVPKAGSCVYLHVWTPGRTGTSGCTALHPADLLELLHWLDPAKNPVLIQLPESAARSSLSGF